MGAGISARHSSERNQPNAEIQRSIKFWLALGSLFGRIGILSLSSQMIWLVHCCILYLFQMTTRETVSMGRLLNGIGAVVR